MSNPDLESTLHAARAHHHAGRLAEAERLYRTILASAPEHPAAMHDLGILALQCRKPAVALELIGRSVQLQPSAAGLNNLGEVFRALGRLPEAIDSYQKALALDPRQVDAMGNFGLALTTLKQWPDAEKLFRQALAISPNHHTAVVGLANLLTQLERHDDALQVWEHAVRLAPKNAAFQRSLASTWLAVGDPYRAVSTLRRAIELEPADAESHANLARALEKINKTDEAIASARKATELAPGAWQAHQNLAALLARVDQPSPAVESFDAAIKLHPGESMLYAAKAAALLSDGRLEEAEASFQKGLSLAPDDARLYRGLASARSARGDFVGAIEYARRAVAIDPREVESHAILAFALLSAGRYEEGFKEYEWRWRAADFTTKPRDFIQPLWDGSDPSGRTILVHSEQGFGDVFQFLRYVPLIRERGAKVVVEASYKLAGLVRRMAVDCSVCVAGTILPAFDLHVPMMSLPAIFQTTATTVPARVPYLSADPSLAANWRSRLDPANGLLVGLVWAGNPKPDPRRSATLNDFAPLVAIPGISLIAMQPSPEAQEANHPPAGMKLINLGPDLRDFADTTASVLANLDLLITIDTSVAHLAGAMGIPTWLLLRELPEWRWMLDETVSRWYPTMRVFRQPNRGDWASVFERVAEELGTLSAARFKSEAEEN